MFYKINSNIMKKIGVIGGMGPEATIQLYKEIVGILQTDFGAKYDSDYPEMYIINLPIPDIVERPDNFAKVEQMMIDACRKLYSLGADYIVIPCNTINIIYEGYNGSVPISILNIIEETAINLKGDGIKKIGLLSTKTTYDSGIYEKYLGKYGIEILKPSQKEIQEVNEIIIRILSGGKSVRDKSFLIEVAQDLVRKGAEGVVLGCTDLSLIIGQEDVSFPIFDTIKILADSAVARLK